MKQILTNGIILRRTNYGEADRIITVLTPDHGKLRLMARGVRKVKSKLAGGIELFSTSQLTYIEGKGEIGTLVSSRLEKHYGRIVGDITRVQLGYELIKLLDKSTEDHPELEYYQLLEQAFAALDDKSIDVELIRLWFLAQLLRMAGHTPNLSADTNGQKLSAEQAYDFDFESMAFVPRNDGRCADADIKVLRLLFSGHEPSNIAKVQGLKDRMAAARSVVVMMSRSLLAL